MAGARGWPSRGRCQVCDFTVPTRSPPTAVSPEGAVEVTQLPESHCGLSELLVGSRWLPLLFHSVTERPLSIPGQWLSPPSLGHSPSIEPKEKWKQLLAYLRGSSPATPYPEPSSPAKLLCLLLSDMACVAPHLCSRKDAYSSLVQFLFSLLDPSFTLPSGPVKSLSPLRCLGLLWVLFCGPLTW